MSVTISQDATKGPETQPSSGRDGHRLRSMPALDGLRGLAVAGVLLYHGNHLKGGWLGVDLFFALSGYLITSLLLAETRQTGGGIDLLAFWGRRARRLFPALLVLICGVAIYAATIATPFDLGEIRSDGLATVFYFANWHAITSSQDYFQISLAPSPFQHTWSLAIEEQFYLVWPLILLVVLRIRRSFAAVMCVAAALAAASVVTMIALHASGASSGRLYYGTDTRSSTLLFGATLAAWQMWRGEHPDGGPRWAVLQVAGLYSFVALLAAWFFLDGQSALPYEGGLAVCGVLATIVIAAASNPRVGLLGRILSWQPLRGLGLISYGVYLYHWPLFLVLDTGRTGLRGWPLFAVQVAATLGAAMISYVLIEQPVRQRRVLRGRKALVAVPLGAILAVVVLLVSTLGAQAADIVAPAGTTGGVLAGPPGSPVVMVVGDSTGFSLGVQMGILRDKFDVTVANFGTIGCGPLDGLGMVLNDNDNIVPDPVTCGSNWGAEARRARPKVTLVLFGFPPVDSVRIAGTFSHACEPAYDNALLQTLGGEVKAIESSGSRVVLMATPYRASTGLIVYFPDYSDQRVVCQNQVLRQVASSTGAAFLDTNRLLCPDGTRCPQEIDGEPIRADGLHFRDTDGSIVVPWVLQQVFGTRATTKPG